MPDTSEENAHGQVADRQRRRRAPRAFSLFMLGSYISMVGSRITTIACPLLALYVTGSPLAAGMVAFAATVPGIIVYVPAGAFVDRLDPWRTMLLSECGRGAVVAALALSLVDGKPSLLVLVVAVVVEEVLEVFSTLADQRCVRSMVPLDQASSAQAQLEARTHVVVLAGRSLGAFLLGLGYALPFVADALTFAVWVLFIVGLKGKRAVAVDAKSTPRQPLMRDVRDGLKFAWGDSYVRAALILTFGTTLIGQALIMMFLAEAHESRLSSGTVGLVLAASGAGGVIGSFIAPRLSVPIKASLLLIQMITWTVTFAFLVVSGAHSLIRIAFVMGSLSLAGALGNIEVGTHFMRHVDEEMLARMISFRRFAILGACAVGPVLGGTLMQFFQAQGVVVVLGVITIILLAFAVGTPSILNRKAVLSAAHHTGQLSSRHFRRPDVSPARASRVDGDGLEHTPRPDRLRRDDSGKGFAAVGGQRPNLHSDEVLRPARR